ncbi:hypothetical protein EIP91_004060 [Steccherinum ochraceum]|uniref:Uncharacterized protein n=1 Tax=Steccherinum ochraceum TaxID=92696 RepID=A0A4R0RBZ7_9APHY|nr:hypothetical protein EIP91_004060 [Steccherinum ochraceum]
MRPHTIPVELLEPIFSFACTDSGQTGCALNATSKTFRSVCLRSSIDIQCAAVYGRAKIRRFLDIINLRERLVVRSVLLKGDFDGAIFAPGADNEVGRECAHLILSVLYALPPAHLRILHILSYDSDRVEQPISSPTGSIRQGLSYAPACLPISFPSLVDLSLTMPLHHVDFYNTFNARTPALRSLRLQVTPHAFGAMLAREFPDLRDLAIECVRAGPGPRDLQWYLHEYCRPTHEYPQRSAPREVQVHLQHYLTTEGVSIVPASYHHGDWQTDFVEGVMLHWRPDEKGLVSVQRLGVGDGSDGEKSEEQPVKIVSDDARTVVVFPPALVPPSRIQGVRLREEWEMSKKVWSLAMGRWGVIG